MVKSTFNGQSKLMLLLYRGLFTESTLLDVNQLYLSEHLAVLLSKLKQCSQTLTTAHHNCCVSYLL